MITWDCREESNWVANICNTRKKWTVKAIEYSGSILTLSFHIYQKAQAVPTVEIKLHLHVIVAKTYMLTQEVYYQLELKEIPWSKNEGRGKQSIQVAPVG